MKHRRGGGHDEVLLLLSLWGGRRRLVFHLCVTIDTSNLVNGGRRATTEGETNRPLVQNTRVLMLKLNCPRDFPEVELCHTK